MSYKSSKYILKWYMNSYNEVFIKYNKQAVCLKNKPK